MNSEPRSTNDQPPFFGPELPLYPVINDFVRIDTPPDDNGVYGGWLRQLASNNPPRFRDRVRVYVFDPNNNLLGPGDYDCRLVSDYLGVLDSQRLPLYATTCCPFFFESSSSSSSSSEG